MILSLREIVSAKKTNISIGSWKSGKVPKADFPMAKQAYGLGNSYRWCVISFVAHSLDCRVLVVVNFQKQKFEAILGVMAGGALRILCSYEYHASEPGWHCHAACDEISKVPIGYLRGPWIKRVPAAKNPHRSLSFRVGTEKDAQRFAFECYEIHASGTLL
jgi:hypothetical protein